MYYGPDVRLYFLDERLRKLVRHRRLPFDEIGGMGSETIVVFWGRHLRSRYGGLP